MFKKFGSGWYWNGLWLRFTPVRRLTAAFWYIMTLAFGWAIVGVCWLLVFTVIPAVVLYFSVKIVKWAWGS